MIDRSAPSNPQRVTVLASVAALHLALLIGFLASNRAPPSQEVKSGAISLMAISPELPAQRPPPPPVLPSQLVEEIVELTAQALDMEPDSTALEAPSGQCATLDLVSKALIADASAVRAVIEAPPETRSIAEAIVIWNVGWSSAASTPQSPLAPARSVVEESLGMVEDSCLDEPIAGPRLIPIAIPDSQLTMFLVVGSGNWTWRQLVTDPAMAKNDPTAKPNDKPWYEIDWF